MQQQIKLSLMITINYIEHSKLNDKDLYVFDSLQDLIYNNSEIEISKVCIDNTEI